MTEVQEIVLVLLTVFMAFSLGYVLGMEYVMHRLGIE